MRNIITVLVLVLLSLPILYASTGVYANGSFTYGNMTVNLSDWDSHYNFKINITVSATHKANYTTVFSKDGKNFTINVSHYIPTANNIPKPLDSKFDAAHNATGVRLDPRTCPSDIAFCYQIIAHAPQNRTTFGKNLSGISSYLLPSKRIREFPCVGNDTSCVEQATNCFCPEGVIGSPPIIAEGGQCTSTAHVCQNSYASFTRCVGNLTMCQNQYLRCGCGSNPVCPAELNTCVTADDRAEMCKGKMPDCLSNHAVCFCGPDVMTFLRKTCTSLTHQCLQGNTTLICKGPFATCALQYDKCDC